MAKKNKASSMHEVADEIDILDDMLSALVDILFFPFACFPVFTEIRYSHRKYAYFQEKGAGVIIRQRDHSCWSVSLCNDMWQARILIGYYRSFNLSLV